MRTADERVWAGVLWASVFLGLAAVWMALQYAPGEPHMGLAQRILYVHVPAAVAALLAFATVFLASIAYLRAGRPCWDHLAAAAAELGIVFSAVVLVTGPIWARPIWGAFWRWEPRLTSMLLLFATYVAYLMIRRYGSHPSQMRRTAAVFGIVAFANIPLVYYSVRLWAAGQQLHPQRVDLCQQMRVALGVATAAFVLLFFLLLHLDVRLRLFDDALAELEDDSSLNQTTKVEPGDGI